MSFELVFFSDCNLNDPFFDSLKEDYQEFTGWFDKKTKEGAQAYIDKDEDNRIHAFLAIKQEIEENEPIGSTVILPAEKRMKISTLKVDDYVKRSRLGEGAIGIALWTWQKSEAQQVYLTTYGKQEQLISLLERFGFKHISDKENGERIYIKDKKTIDYSSPRLSFPFINPNYSKAKFLSIEDHYHDLMFQKSELKGVSKNDLELSVSNGITKIFIATPATLDGFDYSAGDLVFIYRKFTGSGIKGNKSVVTSYCTVSRVIPVKENGKQITTFDQYRGIVGNKSVYSDEEIKEEYDNKRNLFLIELIYNGYFGKGNNITWFTLNNAGIWPDCHPYQAIIARDDVKRIFSMGKVNEQYLNLY